MYSSSSNLQNHLKSTSTDAVQFYQNKMINRLTLLLLPTFLLPLEMLKSTVFQLEQWFHQNRLVFHKELNGKSISVLKSQMWGHTLNQLILAINTALGESALSQRWVWNALSIRVNILYWRMIHLIYFWCSIFSWWGWNKITWILHFLWYLIWHGPVGILWTQCCHE